MHLPTIGPSALVALSSIVHFATSIPVPTIPTGSNVVHPSARSQYEVWTGAIHYQTGVGKIFKNGQTTDISTLLTFDFPSASAGSTCEFHFYLDDAATLKGTGQFDVFSSLAPATGSKASWPPGNQRNQYLGRLQATQPGEATWIDGISAVIGSFPCPTGTWAAELVAVGDADDIEWSGTGAGSYFTFA